MKCCFALLSMGKESHFLVVYTEMEGLHCYKSQAFVQHGSAHAFLPSQ